MLVKELLSTPDKWTKGCAARDVDGVPVSPESPSAECFCLYGAIVHCYGDGPQKQIVARKIRDSIYRVYRHSCSMLDLFNDHHDTSFEHIKRVVEDANV